MPRDASGNYTLPGGINPVVSGTPILASWANTTCPDIGTGITDSLDRSGRGGMLAPLKGVPGSVALPGYVFTTELTTGMSLPAAGQLSFSVGGVEMLRFTASGGGPFVGTLGAVGAPTFTFFGDLNTGMWSPGADQIAWSIGGAQLGLLTADGAMFGPGTAAVANVPFIFRTSDTIGGFRFWNTANSGDTALTQTTTALELVSGIANATNKYGPSIKWGSTDSSFTTTNPKFGAAIVGYATETYAADTDGGMGIAFFTTPDNPGVGGGMVERMTLDHTGRLKLTFGAGSGATANTTADDIVVDSDGNAGLSILCGAGLAVQVLLGETSGNAKGGFAYVGATPEVRINSAIGDMMVRHADVATSFPIGFRNLPAIGNTATAAATGVGKCYLNTAAITVNNGVFAAGDITTVYNNSAAAFNITQGTITTMRLAGTATTGTRSLAARGFATLYFPTATECVVSGNVT